MTVFLPEGQSLEMYFNGPMRSGIVIHSQSLLVHGYTKFQKNLCENLAGRYLGIWEAPDMIAHRSKMEFDIDTRQGRTIIPRYLVCRKLSGDALAEILQEFNLPAEILPTLKEGETSASGIFKIRNLEISVYDFGYGASIFQGDIVAGKDLTVEEYRDLGERISSELYRYADIFIETFTKVAKVIPSEFLLMNFHEKGKKPEGFWSMTALGENIGGLFWVHRIFSIPCNTVQEFHLMKITGRGLVYSAQAGSMEDASLRPDMAIYPGHGNSCLIYEKKTAPDWAIPLLWQVIKAQNIFYVVIEDLDRDLFNLSNDIDRHRNSKDIDFLEKESSFIIDYQSRITFLNSVYDNYDNQLDPQSMKIWTMIGEAWNMKDLFHGVATKAALLEKIHDRMMQMISNLHNKKIGTFILIFTLLSTLSAFVDTIDFTQGHGLETPNAVRMTVLFFMAATAAFFAYKMLKPRG